MVKYSVYFEWNQICHQVSATLAPFISTVHLAPTMEFIS